MHVQVRCLGLGLALVTGLWGCAGTGQPPSASEAMARDREAAAPSQTVVYPADCFDDVGGRVVRTSGDLQCASYAGEPPRQRNAPRSGDASTVIALPRGLPAAIPARSLSLGR